MVEGYENHTNVTKSGGLKFAQYDNILIAQGYITGNGTSTVGIDFPITIDSNTTIPCVVRRRDTAVIDTYYIDSSGNLNGWNGSTNRIFENGKEYQLFFVYVIG